MAGNAKFELSSGSPDEAGILGNYPNGQRGDYIGAHLDRSGSFRESNDGRSLSSGTSSSKGGAFATGDFPLSQYLMLEPIPSADLKSTRSIELRKAFRSHSSASDDSHFGAAHSKSQTAAATEELKRFKSNVLEANIKARNRAKRLDDCLNKLIKYSDVVGSKKLQMHERSGGSTLLKVGNQAHRTPQDMITQKLDDRSRNAVLSKRVRTPMAEMRAEGRGNGIPRQHLGLGKEKDITKEGNLNSDVVEEKIRRLPAGGEGWDKKMKRKRSVSNVFPRPVDGDGELKRAMHGRLGNDSGMQSSDAHNFRSGSCNGSNAANKLDGTPSPASSSGRLTPKHEMEKLPRDLPGMNKERILQKGAKKLNVREDNHLGSPSPMTKAKASRGPRAAVNVPGNSSPSFPRISAVPDDWDQPMNVTKGHSLGGVNNRKRPLPSESSSPPMAQWVGQRPQKISRTRRTNIVSPTSNYDEGHVSSQGCRDSDFTDKSSSGTPNGSLPSRNITSSTHQLKMKIESAPSPVRLSGMEDSAAVENRLKDRTVSGAETEERVVNGYQHVGPSGVLMKKNKLVAKDEFGDGVRRQGRTGRGSSLLRGSMSPLGEKVDNSSMTKPLRSTKPGSEKSGSKSGRPPLKKHSERKGVIRIGPVINCSSPDLPGESDDDREELLEAAQFAPSASYHASCSPFWTKMEPIFYVRQEDKSYLIQQLKPAEEHREQLTQMSGSGDEAMNIVLEDVPHRQGMGAHGGKNIHINGSMESAKTEDMINEFQDNISLCGEADYVEGLNNLTPLYHRVLSALVVEDEFVEYSDNGCARNAFISSRDDSGRLSDGVYCNGKTGYSRGSSNQTHDEIWENNYSYMHLEARASPASLQNDSGGSSGRINVASDLERPYEQMSFDDKLLLELQSVGLSPEAVPDLAEGGDELISQEIVHLKQQLCQETGKLQSHLEKIQRAVEERKEAEGRELELVAMNRLSETAYKKLLATRGSTAARIGASKVPKPVALAFIKRTLSRCRKFEGSGKSCFSEPPLRDVILAGPPSTRNPEAVNAVSPANYTCQLDLKASGSYLDIQNDKSDSGLFDSNDAIDHASAKNGPISNRGKKREILLDDVGASPSLRPPSTLGNGVVGGSKGKRSERDREKDISSNSFAKAARPYVTNMKGERKLKSKPKQKAVQLSTHPVGPSPSGSRESVANGSSRKREGLASPGNVPDSSSEEILDFSNFPMPEMDTIEELNMEGDFSGHQDLGSWLNFDEENLQDHGSMGLEIPMDDLTDLSMLM